MIYIGTRLAARELGVAQRTVNRWINDGSLHAERAFEGGPWLIDWNELRRFSKPEAMGERSDP